MFRKFVYSMSVLVVAIGFAAAEEFRAVITKVEDGKVTYQKYKKGENGKRGEKDGDPATLPTAKDLKVAKAKFNREEKKLEAGDVIEGGLKSSTFAKISDNGVSAFITTDADNKTITRILVRERKPE